jgi:alkyldihydroxyacetonephosphate synthase
MSSKYGKIEDMVISLQIVLPNGDIVHTRSAPRSATGPNFNQLLIGAEGMLGIITRATLRIRPAPDGREFRSYAFPDLGTAVEAMRKIMQRGLTPAVVRLYDETAMTGFFSSIDFPSSTSGCLLILVFEGWPRRCGLEADLATETCTGQGGIQLDQRAAEYWYEHRYSDSYQQSPVLSEEKTVIDSMEVATTWSNLLSLHGAMKNALGKHVSVATTFVHAYRAGCSICFRVVGKAKDLPDTQMYQNLWKDALDACVEAGGTISHHHGVGILKAEWMKRQMGSWMKVYAGLKRRLDPENILNPHKMGLP